MSGRRLKADSSLWDLCLSPGSDFGASYALSLSGFLLGNEMTYMCVECPSGVEREALEWEFSWRLWEPPPVSRVRAQQLPLAGETTVIRTKQPLTCATPAGKARV